MIEAVGTQESAMMQAIRSTRPGGHVGVSRTRSGNRGTRPPLGR